MLMQFRLVFKAATEKLSATTEIEADSTVDAMELAMDIINRRKRNGIRGDHMLIAPNGEKIDLELYEKLGQ